RSPARDIPRAARRVVLRLALFYVLATGIIVAIVPWTEAAAVEASTAFTGLPRSVTAASRRGA
ncbi:hypothetical protein K7G98_42535, partial [Saccharothrix sp. MB29]|nr:hypothetical protein [Saccharothrix sp. MB29]